MKKMIRRKDIGMQAKLIVPIILAVLTFFIVGIALISAAVHVRADVSFVDALKNGRIGIPFYQIFELVSYVHDNSLIGGINNK